MQLQRSNSRMSWNGTVAIICDHPHSRLSITRRAQCTIAPLALIMAAASYALCSEPDPVLPSPWTLSIGGGGGIAAAYAGTSIDSTGTITFSGSSLYPESKDTWTAKLSNNELQHLTALFAAAYPDSHEGQTTPKSYYTWFDIKLDGGAMRSFHPPHSPNVKRLAQEIQSLKERHQSPK